MGLIYLGALAIALTGMVMLDRRFTLFFWRDARRASIVLALGVMFFLAWDLCGIGLGIFFRGETSFMTGLQLAPELPVEELFFLILLCYQTMNTFAAATQAVEFVGKRRARRNAGTATSTNASDAQ
jgi:lycopene cyclase domain-containing protein